jgi:hypothetical protein
VAAQRKEALPEPAAAGRKNGQKQKKLNQCETDKSCPTAAALPAKKAAGSCCSKPPQHDDHDSETSFSAQADSASNGDSPGVSISTCPCGSGKDLAFFGGERSQHVPFRYLSRVPYQQVTQFAFLQPERLASRHGEPPDPPPKLIIS